MKKAKVIKGVTVRNFGVPDLTIEEMTRYVEYAQSQVKNPLKEITLKVCEDGKIDLGYISYEVKFERIRRVTGYLTGDLKSWNDAKQAEERERVKHDALFGMQ